MAVARNQWYVAAYSEEVGDGLLARTICGEPLVMYRTGAGQAVALADRCVHRRFPLSASNRDGDRIVCGYHGFTYAPDGACVAVPGQTRIPRTARVPAYQVVEQDSLVWVWIGDGTGDADSIPRTTPLSRSDNEVRCLALAPNAAEKAAHPHRRRSATQWFSCTPAAASCC